MAIRKLSTVTVLLMVLWETKSLDTKQYSALSIPLDEVGKMLGGWNGQLTKQNSTPLMRGEKYKRVADAAERPTATPVAVVAVDVHVPLIIVPAVERGRIVWSAVRITIP